MRGVVFRAMIPDDLPDVFNLGKLAFEKKYLHYEWTPEKIAETLILSMSYCVSAVRRNNLLGFAIADVSRISETARADLRWICVKPGLRGILEGPIIEALLCGASAKNIDSWTVSVLKNDSNMHNIFIEKGFYDIGEIMQLVR